MAEPAYMLRPCSENGRRKITKNSIEEEMLLLKMLNNRRHSWIGRIIRRTIRYNEFVANILEGAILRKKAMGRPRLQYLKQVARKIGADSYTTVERIACNKSRWKAANQSKY